MSSLSDIPTPCLVIDRQAMDANIARMDAHIECLGVNLRPHVKTNKSIEVSRWLTAAHSGAVTVSTLAEARAFLDGGFSDILYAVGITVPKLAEVADIRQQGAALKIIMDDPAVARQVTDWAKDQDITLECLVEVDVDGHRAGLEPNDPALVDCARILNDAEHTNFLGLMTHAGASYDCQGGEELRAMAQQEHDRMMAAVGALSKAGIDCEIVSIGSTPTALFAEDATGITEIRAGIYVFGDLVQAGLGTCQISDIALSCLTSIVGHKPKQNRLLVDAGGLALSKDLGRAPGGPDYGYGLVVDIETRTPLAGLYVAGVNQEHGMITTIDGSTIDFDQFPIGSRLAVLPNHACMMAAAHAHYHVVDGKNLEVVGVWPRVNYW